MDTIFQFSTPYSPVMCTARGRLSETCLVAPKIQPLLV